MVFKISQEIIDKYPDLNVGVIVANEINNSETSEEVQELLRNAEKLLREKYDLEGVKEIPVIAKWREVYQSFGAKPRDYRNSVEALTRRVLNDKDLPSINLLVDIYNYISIKYLVTAGGEDIDTMEGDLTLDFAKGDEEFRAIGADKDEPPFEGEVVYKDDKGVICRCWNWREGDRSKLTEDTKNAVIVIENMIPENDGAFNEALDELKSLIEKYCNAQCKKEVLNKNNLEVNI